MKNKPFNRIVHKPECSKFLPPRKGLTVSPCNCGRQRPKARQKFIPDETPANRRADVGEGNHCFNHLWISDQTDRN